MSGIKLIFDRINRARNVNAWQHNQNRSQPRLRSPLRQFSCADPDIDNTTESEPVTELGTANPQSSATNTDSFGEMDWAELDEEALEETAAAAPDTLTEQQRLLLSRYEISPNSELETATDLGTTGVQQPVNNTGSTEETDWTNLELDKEFLEETSTMPEESQPPTDTENEEVQTPVPNAKTKQNIFRLESDVHILCPWKRWIYDEDNTIERVQGNGYLKKPSHQPDAHKPSGPSVLREDLTEILKIQAFLDRNPHLRDMYKHPSLGDYTQAHLHGYRRNMCRIRGPSLLCQVSNLNMTGTKVMFDRINKPRKVSAWEHYRNRAQPRMLSPLRQSSCADPDEPMTRVDSDINHPQPKDPIVQDMPPVQAPSTETTTEEPIVNQTQPFNKYCLFRIASVLKSASKVADAMAHLIR